MTKLIYLIIWAHFVCDFVLQTNAMAQGKSSSNVWLGKHIGVYTGALFLSICWTAPLGSALAYALMNGAAHFGVDYVTSRMTKKLWAEKRVHDFFVVIGADQAIHMSCLIATLPLLRSA